MKLPITKEQRRRIEYRARWMERNRMVRAFRRAMEECGITRQDEWNVVSAAIAFRADMKGSTG